MSTSPKPKDNSKVENYRDALHELAKHGRKPSEKDREARHLEGEAAKLGTEIQDEHSKAPPHSDRQTGQQRKR